MPYIRPLDQLTLDDIAFAGSKAARLGASMRAGLPVPGGFCIGAPAYRALLAANRIDDRIAARLAATDIQDPVDLESAAEDIRVWIEQANLPPEIEAEILAAMHALNADASLFAVRASRIAEDVVSPRSSGLDQAFLAVKESAVEDTVRRCWATPWTSRAIYFRSLKGIPHEQAAIALVIQPMVNAEAAGVMFTANPRTRARDEIHIDATWGIGEAVVAARWKPDHYVLDKATLTMISSEVVNKRVMETVSFEGGMQTIAVPEEKQDAPCLSEEQAQALAALGKRAEELYQAAQDLEWCRTGPDLILLQTRPLYSK